MPIYTSGYLACNDEEIRKRQKKIKQHNDKLIEEHNKLPRWKRFCKANDLRQTITANWVMFSKWMDKRMEEQKNKQRRPELRR